MGGGGLINTKLVLSKMAWPSHFAKKYHTEASLIQLKRLERSFK